MAPVTGLAIAAVALALILPSSSTTGKAAPRLPARALSGSDVTLASLRGEPALVNFFASWCTGCIREARDVERAYLKLGRRAHVVSVAWDDRRQATLSFLKRYGWTMPVLEDESGLVGNAYGIAALPTAFVLDSSGHILKRLTGPQTLTGLLAAVPG